MNKKQVIIAAAVTLFASTAWAAVALIPNTFTAGSPAVAADVNANFAAVKTAVDDNNTRINTVTASATTNTTSVASNTTAVSGLQGAASLVRTVIVKPVLGVSGLVDSFASGVALINAVAGIVSASPTNPYLVKLEAGTFDLGSQMLSLPDGVHLEGAGSGATTITSFIAAGNAVPRSAAVQILGVSSIKHVKVQNTMSGVSNAAIAVNGAASVANIYYVEAIGGTAILTEIGAKLKLFNSKVTGNRIETLWLTNGADTVDVVNTGMKSALAYHVFAARTKNCFNTYDHGTFAALNAACL